MYFVMSDRCTTWKKCLIQSEIKRQNILKVCCFSLNEIVIVLTKFFENDIVTDTCIRKYGHCNLKHETRNIYFN